MKDTKVWFITGASKGMGLSLVKDLLAKGEKVAATSRAATAFAPFVDRYENFLPLQTDLENEHSVAAALKQTVGRFGSLDVVVNNAGYGLGGALEELSEAEIRANFEINFFAVLRVIQQALPYLRQQRSGHIINISSIAGLAPGTGWTAYSAAKFAVSGLSEALANDLKPLGIQVTNVLPGWFRTSFAKAGSIAYAQKQIAGYDHIRTAHENMSRMDGAQGGDPAKLAGVFLALVHSAAPAVNLVLGSDALYRAQYKLEQMQAELNTWKAVSVATDFNS